MLLIFSDRMRIWKKFLASSGLQSGAAPNEERSNLDYAFRLIFGFPNYDPWKMFRNAALAGESHPTMALKARKVVTAAMKEFMHDDMFPIAEVIKFFCNEHTPETEIDHFLSNLREEDIKGYEKKQELIGKVLLVASDAQTVTGISPSHKYKLVFTFYRRNCLDYHRNGPAAGFKSLPFAHHIRYYQLYIVRGRATLFLEIRFNR